MIWTLHPTGMVKEGEPLLSPSQRKSVQHRVANYMKSHGKECYGKGIDIIQATIMREMMVVRMGGFVTRTEDFLLSTDPNGWKEVQRLRLATMDAMVEEGTYVATIESLVGAKVCYLVVDVDPRSEQGFFTFVFDQVLF